MALGTITLVDQAQKSPSTPVFLDEVTIVGDGSYPTGGTVGFQALFRAATGIKENRIIDAVIDIGGIAGHYPLYDAANDKLMTFVRTTGVETANAVNLSATTFRVLVISH